MTVKFKNSALSRLIFSTICTLLVIYAFVQASVTNNEMAMWGWGLVVAHNVLDTISVLAKYLKKRSKRTDMRYTHEK